MVLAIKSLGKIVEMFEIDSLKLFKEDPRVIVIKILHIYRFLNFLKRTFHIKKWK